MRLFLYQEAISFGEFRPLELFRQYPLIKTSKMCMLCVQSTVVPRACPIEW